MQHMETYTKLRCKKRDKSISHYNLSNLTSTLANQQNIQTTISLKKSKEKKNNPLGHALCHIFI